MRIWLWTCLTLSLLAISWQMTALGQESPQLTPMEAAETRTRELDRDGDGGVSLEELFREPAPAATDLDAMSLFESRKDWYGNLFRRADSDRNGVLSSREVVRFDVLLKHE